MTGAKELFRTASLVYVKGMQQLREKGELVFLDTDLFTRVCKLKDTVPAFAMGLDVGTFVFFENLTDCPTRFPKVCPSGKSLAKRDKEDCKACPHKKCSPNCPLGKEPIYGLLYRPEGEEPAFFY